jgi:hypothetical protein
MLIPDALDVFRKGKMIANPMLWKNIGATSSVLAGLVTSALAVAAAFGYRLDLDSHVIEALASGLAAVLFLLSSGVHVVTTDKIGLPAKPEPLEPSDITGSHDAGFDADIFKSRG